MRKIYMSLGAKLCLYILTLTAVIFACVAAVFRSYTIDRQERQATEYTAVLLQNMVEKIDRKLFDVEHSVMLTAPIVEDFMAQPDSLMPIVAAMVGDNASIMGGCVAFRPGYYPKQRRLFMEYASIDSLGELQTKHLGGPDYDYTKMEWYTRPMVRGEGLWSEPYHDEGGGDVLMTTYTMPIEDRHKKPFAVLTADVAISQIVDATSAMRPYVDSYSFIVSAEGRFLSHPDTDVVKGHTLASLADSLESEELLAVAEKMQKGESGTARLTLRERDMLLCYAPIPRTAWAICLVCPYSTIMGGLGSATLTILAIFLVGLLLLALCIRLVLVVSTRPLTQLADTTYRIAAGHFNEPLPDIHTKDEMRKLCDAFAHLQASLRQYIAELTDTTRVKERIESELHIAQNIQMSMVPQTFPASPGLDTFALMKPAKEVGGDLYDLFVREGKLFFAVGDVSGKGMPAALVMSTTTTIFRLVAQDHASPARIMAMLNHAMAERNTTDMFITLFVGTLDLATGQLRYCNAGHNPPLIIAPDGGVSELTVDANLPIGIVDGFTFTEQERDMAPREALFVFTDGLTEAENAANEQLGDERTTQEASRMAGHTAKETVEAMRQLVANFAGDAPQSDDLTMMCLRFRPDGDTTTMKKTLTVENKIDEIAKLEPFIASIGAALELPQDMVNSINLAIEEAMANSIEYAYTNGASGTVSLEATLDGAALRFTLTDQGQPFDPTQAAEADVTLALDDRPIGGLGIFLVRQIMDTVEYRRENQSNILTMTKRLGG